MFVFDFEETRFRENIF